MISFKDYLYDCLLEDLTNVESTDVLSMFLDLKLYLNKIVKESESSNIDTSLKLVAVFETFYSYFKNHHKLELGQVPGFGAFVKDYSHETVEVSKFEQFVKKISNWIQRRENDKFDIKRITEQRFKQFQQWVNKRDQEGCNIIAEEIDKIIKSLKTNVNANERLFNAA